MGKRLQDNLSSKYFEAANKLNSKKSRRRIVAYVESYDDIFFWRSVLSRFENENLYFEVMLPTHDFKLERGKKAVMMNLLCDKVGKNMIACVDADYDYLVQGKTFTSETILSNPYIFHTYAYAIENLQCFAPSLHDVCVAVTLNDHDIFDMVEYLRQFSVAIFPLFVWNIWYYRSDTYRDFTMTDFNRIIETGNFVMDKADSIIDNVRRKVQQKVKQLQQRHPDAKESYLAVKDDLRRLGVKPETVYLYIQGHHLFDKVVVPMMKKVCDKLIREREQEIRHQSIHHTQYRNEMSCYSKSVIDVSGMLRRNVGYMRSDLFLRIVADVGRFLNDGVDKPTKEKSQI
ncbi:MAG: DUF4435 domain-containing protein [Prevotella sp.]|nr:DUF4435 domain-containing protein [Prevotella sp.]